MNGLLEILTTKQWMVLPDFLHSAREVIEHNLNNHAAIQLGTKRVPFAAVQPLNGDKMPDIREYQVTEDGTTVKRYGSNGENILQQMKVPFVNVIPVDGPITRNGGACSYGSVELRDWLIEAANHPKCVAHVFYIDSPGGAAFAKYDFQQAIDYAHSLNQKVIAFVDGLCASAAIYLASFCDEVYVMHPKNQIGSVGVMAAFYSEKDGTTNKYTNETYHELYDPESCDKNKWYRDIAEGSSDEILIDDLRKAGEEFRADILRAFPAATEEHIHGKLFNADEVMGIFVDGQMTFSEVITRAFALANGSAQPITRTAPAPKVDEPAPNEEPKNNQNSTTQNPEEMKDYPNIAATCGMENIQAEENASLSVENLDALENALTQAATERTNAAQQIQDLQGQLATAKQQASEATTAHEQEIADLNAQHATALQEAQKATTEAQQALQNAQQELANAQQTIRDRDAQIAALTSAPASQQNGSPASNGTSPKDNTPHCAMPAYDESKSPLENARIRREAGF